MLLKVILAVVAMAVAATALTPVTQWAPVKQDLPAGTPFSDIDFYSLISGPMVAVVDAQIVAARTTTQFIQDVGYTLDPNSAVMSVVMANFHYEEVVNNTVSTRRIVIPFLYMVPVPYVQVDNLQITFNAQVNSVYTRVTNETTRCSGSLTQDPSCQLSSQYALPDFGGGISAQKTETSSLTVKKNYQLTISVRCSQSSLPGGMSRVLDLFDAIVAQDRPTVNQSKTFV